MRCSTDARGFRGSRWGFDRVDRRLDGVDWRLERLQSRIEDLEKRELGSILGETHGRCDPPISAVAWREGRSVGTQPRELTTREAASLKAKKLTLIRKVIA